MKEDNLNIGNSIKKYRELKDITREHMAAELDMSLSGYSKIERNEVDLTISRIQQIAQILQVDISQILNFDASQIFNISNNKLVNASVSAENMHFHTDDYKEKYIKILEADNMRLKKLAGEI